jgi:hypothetical protein
MDRNSGQVVRFLDNPEVRDFVTRLIRNQVYTTIQRDAPIANRNRRPFAIAAKFNFQTVAAMVRLRAKRAHGPPKSGSFYPNPNEFLSSSVLTARKGKRKWIGPGLAVLLTPGGTPAGKLSGRPCKNERLEKPRAWLRGS